MYESAKAVICVSIKLMELMKERESDIAFKFRYAHFGFDFEKVEEEVCDGDVYRDSAMCITVGGGSPRKNNIPVCEAIKRLNDGGMDLKLTIIGYSLEFGEKLRSYDFVTYYELLPHQDVIRLMKGSALYIQNSIFDSFSIAVMESIGCGCSVLISSGTGASESLSTIESSDIVYDTYNVGEIAEKIKYLVEHPNASRIRAGIDAASCSDRVASRRLYELLAELEKEG
jgi:glycosyltransferase involved in cell wall biosynthesis